MNSSDAFQGERGSVSYTAPPPRSIRILVLIVFYLSEIDLERFPDKIDPPKGNKGSLYFIGRSLDLQFPIMVV